MLLHQSILPHPAAAPALLGAEPVTYGMLRETVAGFRNYLYAQGIRPGDRVGLLARNTPEFIYTYLAVISLGAIIVPLNFQLVAREIAYIIQDAAMQHLVVMQPLALDAALAECGWRRPVKQLRLADISANLNNAPPAPPYTAGQPEDCCTIIYTSGTTGHPKGAMLSHQNLLSNATAFLAAFPFRPTDRTLCVLPMYHCFAWTCAALTPLVSGSSLLILETFTIRETIAAMRSQQLTIIFAVPAMYSLFAQWCEPADIASVRLFVSGGASLPQEVSEQFTAKLQHRIVEGYGLSEASPVVSLNPREQVKYRSVGRPLPGVSVRIAAPDGSSQPPGAVGELLVQGPNVMLGYHQLPDASAAALQDGWLHTGDLAYLDEDGYIFIVDRLKDLIITSGENIYPREIEEVLYAHPGIAEAAVIGLPDPLRGTSVYAYVVPKEEATLEPRPLKRYLQERLAAYKVPREIRIVSSLPKNSTGKILKRVLREQALHAFDA